MDKVEVRISKKYVGKTIKEYLKANNVGRGKVEAIRVNKASFINGEYKNLETKLEYDDLLTFTFEEEVDFLPDDVDLDVAYEDDQVLIVNKPANMIIHPDDKSKTGTLVNVVANYYIKNNIHRKVRFIHRIDKETTGLILFAKDFLSEAILLKALENRHIIRKYLALVDGVIEPPNGSINKPIKEDRHKNSKMIVSRDGKEALTNYKVIEKYDDYSLVEFELKTGRTHQIRVHSSFIRHPLLGDVLYGGTCLYIDRVALHSYLIDLLNPITKKKILVEAALPQDMQKLLKK